jgi:2-polyprenyl-3-methyl-5-hydroxy-6-metoxy-1,4-benzoquinol methylase
MCGFDMLSREQWREVVYSLTSSFMVDKPISILDVGCGVGAFVSVLKDNYPSISVCGFDACDSFISIAKIRVGDRFWTIDATQEIWGLGDEKFDVVMSFSVFQYLNNLEIAKEILRKMASHLKDAGSIFIGDLPDSDKESQDRAFRQGRNNLSQLSVPGVYPDHQYYPKSFFIDFASDTYAVDFLDHSTLRFSQYFPNSMHRYSVVLRNQHD